MPDILVYFTFKEEDFYFISLYELKTYRNTLDEQICNILSDLFCEADTVCCTASLSHDIV